MSLNRLKVGAIVLMASCTLARMETLAPGKGRISMPDGLLIYVSVSSTAEGVGKDFLSHFMAVNILPKIRRVPGVGTTTSLVNRPYEMRFRLDPDRMRTHNMTTEDIKEALRGCSMIDSPEQLAAKTWKSKEYELTHLSRFSNPKQYEEIILKASPEGEILRIKDVGRVELIPSANDYWSDIDGHPSAVFALKQAPGSDAAEVIESVKKELGHIKEESFPPGMEFQVSPLDGRNMICAVIQAPREATLEDTIAGCHELAAIARGIDGITSVTSLAGYQIRTEGRDPTAATCLIHLRGRSGRTPTARQIIETLREKCRNMDVDLEFFESPEVLDSSIMQVEKKR